MHGQRYTVYWRTNVAPPPAFIAHYQFNETGGTAAADATGNGRTASLVGGASWVAGRQSGAVSLNGTDGHVRLPSGILAGATDFTVAGWVRLGPVATWSRVFDFGTGTNGYLFLTPMSGAGTARFAITLRPAALGSTGMNYLGRSQYSGDPLLAAELDDVRVYGRALSATEIRSLATA